MGIMEWLIAHNLGILVIIVPLVVISLIWAKLVEVIKNGGK